MKQVAARYIKGVEKMSEQDIFDALCAVESVPVGCVNWKEEFPYAPSVCFHLAFSDEVLAVLFEVKEDHVLGTALESNGLQYKDGDFKVAMENVVVVEAGGASLDDGVLKGSMNYLVKGVEEV